MSRFTLILVAFALGCHNSGVVTRPPTQQTTTTTARSKQTAMKPIELHYGIYLARIDHRITVSADGRLHSVRTDNKSYGGNDIDSENERVEVREGKLTAEQVAELVRLFADWDSLSTTPYGGAPDGGDISIRYGDRIVSGGSEAPRQVMAVRVRLMELSKTMPVVK